MAMTLELRGLEKRYGGFELGPIDLSVSDVTAVLGPSGCGKTTLLSMVAGLVEPDAGDVRLAGRRLDGLPPEERGTAMVFQDGALFPHLTARENVAYAATSSDRVESLSASLELDDVLDLPATALSGGEVQRVALARALAADPDALLLDEPLSNLDAPIRRRVRGDLRAHLTALDVPVLYVTHDQRGAAAIGDRIAVMTEGTFHQVGDPRSVFERPATSFVASFTGVANVFRATVAESDERLLLEWGDRTLAAAPSDVDVGASVEWYVRPEYVELGRGIGENAFDARIERATFEGDVIAVSLRVDDRSIEARLPPARFDALDAVTGDTVSARLPPEAVHVLDQASTDPHAPRK